MSEFTRPLKVTVSSVAEPKVVLPLILRCPYKSLVPSVLVELKSPTI